MSPLKLLTAEDCHFCEHAKGVLAEAGIPYVEISPDSEEGQRLADGAPPLRPVLYSSHERMLAYGRLSARRLRKQHERGELQ